MLEFFKNLKIEDLALEIFLTFLILSWFFYFLKYISLLTAILINLLTLLSWIVYFIRLKEENEKKDNIFSN